MAGAFRSPFPGTYGMAPPRNVNVGVMQGYPGLPNHRTTQQQSIVGAPSPGLFTGQRGGGGMAGFPFSGSLQQPQPQNGPPPQHQQSQHMPSTTPSASIPPHLSQQQQQQPSQPSTTPSVPSSAVTGASATASSATSTSEVGLDPNDFPALGSGANGNSNSATTPALLSTYASQAGTNLQSTVGNAGSREQSGATRDFGPDDFPALGGQTQNSAGQQQDSHNGLNGFSADHLRSGSGTLSGLVGGQQSRVFHNDSEKRNFNLKANQATQNQTWTSPNTNTTFSSPLTNGGPNHQQSLNPPSSGVPPLSGNFNQSNHAPIGGHQGSYGGEQLRPASTNNTGLPQTPAQQILMSAADRWGLLGLLAMIKSSDPETALISIGSDLGTMGLDMQQPGYDLESSHSSLQRNLYSSFITPWSDSSAAHSVEPDFHLPACYSVQPAPIGSSKAAAFSDETLFFMFYSHPRDVAQEVAAQELWNRNWRFHKELRVWITKETGTSPSTKHNGSEHGTFTLWDPDNWEKTRKHMHVAYSDLEEKTQPAFPGAGINSGSNATAASNTASSGVQQSQPRESTSGPLPVNRGYAGMGMNMAM
ncbi:hypothetical protein SISSUDRAFT_1034149 [Sistotremastrum suecicum HHB10207 ss-3]|uniref:NOT2/NOT3/NOT5 C-terminal domain-containing protein n=1 Tax=Sistotremastrum suecicum HHB10207 ss-3 TaxID=1314776 RepID=A0A166CDN1_9AGAM|nr:hypothetical protein SISSUDRAFT_1034149 [Sistotremastrum suecicum HHB10207 ss-3]